MQAHQRLKGARVRPRELPAAHRRYLRVCKRRDKPLNRAFIRGHGVLRHEDHHVAAAALKRHVPRAAVVKILALNGDQCHARRLGHRPRVVRRGRIHNDDLVRRQALPAKGGQQAAQLAPGIQRGNDQRNLHIVSRCRSSTVS